MKKLSILSATILPLLIVCTTIFGQTPIWIARYDNANARVITTDAEGNIYVTGPADGGKKTGIDFLTVKYTSTGNLVWASRYNNSIANGEDWPFAIAVDGSDDVYVTGRSITSSSGKFVNYDYATVKYNSNGILQWAKRYGSAGNKSDIPQDVKVDAGGYIYVTGFADAPSWAGGGNAITTIKYDPSGETKWTNVYDVLPNLYDGPNPNREEAYSLALDGTGNVYVAGSVIIKYNNNGGIVWVNLNQDDRRKIVVDASGNIIATGFSGKTAKYDGLGNLVWQSVSPETGFWDAALDQAGNVYVTGNTGDESGNSSDYWTVKYDGNNGSEQWASRFNGSANSTDFARSIAVDNSGNVFVTGHSTAANGRNTIVNIGTIKYNNAGQQQWTSFYEGDGFGIAADPWDNIYVAGTSASTRTTPGGIVLLKYVPGSAILKSVNSNTVFENKTPTAFDLHNYPNPFYQTTTIEYQLPVEGKVKLTVFDLSGHEIAILVNETKPAGVYKVNFSANKLPAGTYLCRMQVGDVIQTKKLALLK